MPEEFPPWFENSGGAGAGAGALAEMGPLTPIVGDDLHAFLSRAPGFQSMPFMPETLGRSMTLDANGNKISKDMLAVQVEKQR